MTIKHLREQFEFYANKLRERGITPERLKNCSHSMPHTLWMCNEAVSELIPNSRIPKAFRWLGFVQRAFLGFGVFNLQELKDQSRPTDIPLTATERLDEITAWLKYLNKEYGVTFMGSKFTNVEPTDSPKLPEAPLPANNVRDDGHHSSGSN